MAEQIVSPGVFTNEKDLSFLPAGIAAIGAVVIGPTQKGPAFVPTVVSSFTDFTAMFGGLSETTYVPYTIQNYLRNAGSVTVVRVLQEGGYKVNSALALVHSSSLGFRTIGLILPSAKNLKSDGYNLSGSSITSSIGTPGSGSVTGSFRLTVGGGGVTQFSLSASIASTSPIRIDSVLGTSVMSNQNAYDYAYFNDYATSAPTGSNAFISASFVTFALSGSADGGYRPAATPFITSQLLTGQNPKTLFRFYTLADGTDTNTTYKISVVNQTLPTNTTYGTFTILVRDYNDTDQRPLVLETFSNLNLNPDSPDYIARRIGDKYNQINTVDNTVTVLGSYNNVSKYVRVSMDTDVDAKGTSILLYPKGHSSIVEPFPGPYNMPTASYVTQNMVINGLYSTRAYYGWNFASADNANYLNPIASGSTAGGNVAFNLDNCFFHPSSSALDSRTTGYTPSSSLSGSILYGVDVSNFLKFTVPFQNGFDGADPAIPTYVGSNITATNTMGMDCSSAGAAGSSAYIKAMNILSNADQYDFNIIATPGITIDKHSSVVNKAIDLAETRGDTFVIADCTVQGQNVATAIQSVANSGIDSSYAGTYWPWVKILDTDKNKPVWVPPSVVLPGVLAYNDTAAYEWFAPAGLNRGGITTAVDIETKLTFSQRDALYAARINPIATFPNQGVCVWGQKTLQVRASALDRINVRRLLIALKKYIASSTRYLVFDNNTTETRQRFLNIVNPYLEKVKSRQGLYAFRVVMDETNNTPDVIDRNIMYGQIYLQPAKAAEFIILDFNVLPTGATFNA